MDWSMTDQIQSTKQTMSLQKQNISNQYQNISVIQGFSSAGPSFKRKKGERMKDNHSNLSTNHSRMQDDKSQSLGVNTANDYENLKGPEEVFTRHSKGLLRCKACSINFQSGANSKQHLKGSVHAFFLQLYNNKSKPAILVKDALKRGTIKHHRGVKFFCRSCSITLEYNSLALLAGHLLSVEHDLKTGKKDIPSAYMDFKALQTSSTEKERIEVMKGNFDELTVMSCQLCRAEVSGLNIDNHVKSIKHRASVDKLEGGSSNPLAFTTSNDMSPEEAIECGIVTVKDLMTYFCNVCEKLLTADGTINPLKTHLESSNHKLAACFSSDEVKNTVKHEIMDGILVFKFKANKMSYYLDEVVNPKDAHQDTASSLDTMNQQTTVYQDDKSNSSHSHDFVKMKNYPKLSEWKHKKICWYYNVLPSGGCHMKNCKRMHVCSNCNEEHSQQNCTYNIMVPTWEEWKNEPTCFFYNFNKNGCNREDSCERYHMCTHCQHSDHGWLKCIEQDKYEIRPKTKVPSWEEWKNEPTCYFYNFNNNGCKRGVSCKRQHKCTHCQHLNHGWLRCTEQDKNEFRSKKKENDNFIQEKNEMPFQAPRNNEMYEQNDGCKRRRRNEDRYQQDDKYKNTWLKPQGVERGSKNRNEYASLKSIPMAPSPPAISDSYENKNLGYYEPQNSYQQYSTEYEINYLGRDYHQQESLHGIVETRNTFNISERYNDHTLINSEVYGYQNMESRMQPHPIRERNIEGLSTIRSTSKGFNQIINPSKPFSPFEAVLILGCLVEDLGIFGETVKAICKKAVEDKDNILRVFKEDEIRMTMNVVADKLKALIESAVDKPSKEKFKLGLEKVILLLQHSVDA